MPPMRPGEFARYLEVSPGYISNLKRDGRLVLSSTGLILVAESLNRIEATRKGKKPNAVLQRNQSLIAKLSANDQRVTRIVRMHFRAIRLENYFSAKLARLAKMKLD